MLERRQADKLRGKKIGPVHKDVNAITVDKLIRQTRRACVYPEEICEQAIKTYYYGMSWRKVSTLFGMGKENIYRL